MTTPNKSSDWMLVTVRGYDEEKGYIFGNRHPDGEGVIIAKKNSVKRDWLKSMSSERERTFTPPKSIIAVFGAELLDEKTGFTIASWATPISKNLGNEDVFITPIKLSATPKQLKTPNKNEKSVYIDAVVMDQYARPVREINELQAQVLDCLSPNSASSFNLSGPRGFMIRIGHTSKDGSLDATGWEFFGRKENSPHETWNFYWNQTPQAGRDQNLLKAILTAAQHAFRDPASYVEVVGLSRVLVNDFGDEVKVNELAGLPNYKTKSEKGIFASYSLAAIAVETNQSNRIIKQQIPLPRNKIINSFSGLLGNHIPGNSVNPIVKPIVEPFHGQIDTPALPIDSRYPLVILDHVNQQGEVRSFEVLGSKQDLEKYRDRIEQAIVGITPFKVRGKDAYSFPIKFKREVQSSLFDITGGAPVFIQDVDINGNNFIGLSGQTAIEPYKSLTEDILKKLGATTVNERLVVEERFRPQLAASLNEINDFEPRPILSAVTPLAINKPRETNNVDEERISFSQWQESKFGKSPDAMLDFLSGEVEAYAKEAGIDWVSARKVVSFRSANSKGEIVRSKEVHPFDKAHAGSVAMAAHVTERLGTKPGDSIIWFKINFFNKKLLKDRVITFDSYQFLKEEYDRDIKTGVLPSKSNAELEEIKRQTAQRELEAEARRAKQIQDEQNSRTKWARQIASMPKETGENLYWSRKGVASLLNEINAKSGLDNDLGRYTIIPLHDLNRNYLGAQRIYENHWSDGKGRTMNKKYIYGTLLKNEHDMPYGTHYLVGEINPSRPIIFCEGFADAGTNRAASGLPVVVCLDKGNLYNVVGMYRQAYPNTRLIIAHDNDIYNKKNGNVGFASALDASRDHGAEYVGPDFSVLDQNAMEKKPTDFNDLQQFTGLDEIKRQIRNVKTPPKDLLEFHKLKVQVIGLEKLESYLKDAVKEILATNDNISDNSIYRSLLLRAILTYGHDDVTASISDATKSYLNTPLEIEEPKQVHSFPVSVIEKDGASGKKFSLIIDHEKNNSSVIEDALKTIVGKNHLPFNEHLQGWVAPYQVIRLLDSYLYEKTGAPRLYIGQSRAKDSPTHYVVRGNFSDSEFRNSVAEGIRYANPHFIDSEYGFVISDARAIPYIKETLKNYLADNKDLSVRVTPTLPATTELNQKVLDQAVRLSGESRGNIVLALYTLAFQNNGNLFKDDDFAFAAIYSRSLNQFSHLETDTRHKKALSDSIRACETIIEHGVADTVLDEQSVIRLQEIVEQLGYLLEPSLDNAPTDNGAPLTENLIDDNLNSQDETQSISTAPENKSIISESDVEESVSILKPKNEAQILRVNQLLEIVRLVVEKGFDEEDLYEHFITQPASPYFDYTKGAFDDVLYRQDLLYLSTTDQIADWKPTTIHTTSQLFYTIYNEVARNRIAQLETYINGYLEDVGATTFKTFNKYLSGSQSIPNGYSHPYIMEGEVNFDLISHDLEHLTNLTSIHDLYRELSNKFILSEKTLLNEIQNDIFSDPKANEDLPSSPVAVYESSSSNISAVLVEYPLEDQSVYELIMSSNSQSSEQSNLFHFHFEKDQLIQYASSLLAANPESLRFASLPDYSESGISTSITERTNKNGLQIELQEVDLGSKSFYIVDMKDTYNRTHAVEERKYFLDFDKANACYNLLLDSEKNRLEDTRKFENNGAGILSSSPAAKPERENLGQRFREWAQKSIPVDDVIQTLKAQYRMVLSLENENSIKEQYKQLVIKLAIEHNISNVLPEERFDQLHKITVEFAKNELMYDEYLDELFKTNGARVESNPYWNDASKVIDRKAALEDIKLAGYKSLHQFYESVYTSIHSIKSTDLHLRRIGGFIPDSLELSQPLRPQFQNLNKLFQSNVLDSDRNINLLPFNDWIHAPSSFGAIHPILSEDLADVNAEELSSKYGDDAILLLADIHGVNVSVEKNKFLIASEVLDQWRTRQAIGSLSRSELGGLDPITLTEYLQTFNLPIGGTLKDRTNRISEHCDLLRSLSKLRLAQYSYIGSALELEQRNVRIPAYVYRSINTFINNEVEFAGSVKATILDIEKSVNRKDIDIAIELVSSISSINKALIKSVEYQEPKVYGIDSNRDSAIIFSDNYDKLKGTLSRYKFKYQTDKEFKLSQLPGEITHYVQFGDRLVGTPSPIDNNRLTLHKLSPVSESAIASAANPLIKWMNRFGYGCFADFEGNKLLCHKADDQWQIVKLSGATLENLYRVSELTEFLTKESNQLGAFIDRDPLIESWLDCIDHDLLSNLRQLSHFNDSSINENDHVHDIIKAEPYISLLGPESNEPLEDKIKILSTRLERVLFDEAWKMSQGIENSFEIFLHSAQSLTQHLPPVVGSRNVVDLNEFLRLEPLMAINLYESYIGSENTINRELFSTLEEKFLNPLSSQQKHLLSVEIASGSYESIGHFLHEKAVEYGISNGMAEAINIHDRFYSNSTIDISPSDVVGAGLEIEKLYLSVDGDNSLFVKLIAEEADFVYAEEVVLSSGKNDNVIPFTTFRSYPEAIHPPAPHFEIDPSTEQGFSHLNNLSFSTLSDFAAVYGVKDITSRQNALDGINDIVQTRNILHLLQDNINANLSIGQISLVSKMVGHQAENHLLLNTLQNWEDSRIGKSQFEIIKRNYESYLQTAKVIEPKHDLKPIVIKDKNSLIPVVSLPDVNFIVRTVNDIREIPGYLQSEDAHKLVIGHAFLNIVGLRESTLLRMIENLNSNFSIKPIEIDSSLAWSAKQNIEGTTLSTKFDSLVDAIKASKTTVTSIDLIEGTQVAWIENSNISYGHVASNAKMDTSFVTVAVSSANGRTFAKDIPINEVCTFDEDAIKATIFDITKQISSKSTGDITEIEKLINSDRYSCTTDLYRRLLIDKTTSYLNELTPEFYKIKNVANVPENGYATNTTFSETSIIEQVELNDHQLQKDHNGLDIREPCLTEEKDFEKEKPDSKRNYRMNM